MREAIIDHTVGVNHNNKHTHGKTFSRRQDRRRADARAYQYLRHSLFVVNSIACRGTLISKDGRICNVFI